MAGKRKTTPRQDLAIRDLVIQGFTSPTWVLTYLEDEGILEPGHEIDEKIIKRRIKDFLPRDASGRWSVIDDVPGDARSILGVAHWLYSATAGRVWLTRDLARLVGHVSASPDLPPNWAWAFARAYQSAHARKDGDVRCLDLALWSQVWDISRDRTEAPVLDKRATTAAACQRIGGSVGRRQWDDLIATIQALPFSDVEAGPFPDPWEDAEPEEYAELFDDSEERANEPPESLLMNS